MHGRDERAWPLHPIGAAASLSGLPADTIRTWERRYGAVTPARSGSGGRRYGEADVERLILLRRLTEQGLAIGEIARLADDELRARLERVTEAGFLRVGVRDEAIARRLDRVVDARWTLQRLPSSAELEDFRGHALIVTVTELGEAPAARAAALREHTGATVFVVYTFAPRLLLEQIAAVGAWLLPSPLRELDTLRRLVRLAGPLQPSPAEKEGRPARSASRPPAAEPYRARLEAVIEGLGRLEGDGVAETAGPRARVAAVAERARGELEALLRELGGGAGEA